MIERKRKANRYEERGKHIEERNGLIVLRKRNKKSNEITKEKTEESEERDGSKVVRKNPQN